MRIRTLFSVVVVVALLLSLSVGTASAKPPGKCGNCGLNNMHNSVEFSYMHGSVAAGDLVLKNLSAATNLSVPVKMGTFRGRPVIRQQESTTMVGLETLKFSGAALNWGAGSLVNEGCCPMTYAAGGAALGASLEVKGLIVAVAPAILVGIEKADLDIGAAGGGVVAHFPKQGPPGP